MCRHAQIHAQPQDCNCAQGWCLADTTKRIAPDRSHWVPPLRPRSGSRECFAEPFDTADCNAPTNGAQVRQLEVPSKHLQDIAPGSCCVLQPHGEAHAALHHADLPRRHVHQPELRCHQQGPCRQGTMGHAAECSLLHAHAQHAARQVAGLLGHGSTSSHAVGL